MTASPPQCPAPVLFSRTLQRRLCPWNEDVKMNQQEAGGVCHRDQIWLVEINLELFFFFNLLRKKNTEENHHISNN